MEVTLRKSISVFIAMLCFLWVNGQTVPVDFEDTNITYTISGFGAADFGAIPAEIIPNPDNSGINTSTTVAHINKSEGAQIWAGASIELSEAIDLATLGSVFEMKVWSPRLGVPISIKLEDADSPPDANGNPSIFAEIIMTTTTFNEWGTLTFDFSQDVANYSVDNEYDRIVIFPDIGNAGVTGGESFYFDDIQPGVVQAPMPTLPLSFENPTLNYVINSFGGPNFEPIPAEITTNPDIGGLNTSPTILHINKPEGAQWWAGAGLPLGSVIDFSQSSQIEMRVWSPRADVPISFKIEDTDSPLDADGNPSVKAEVQVNTTTANAWEILIFDMALDAANFSSDNQYDGIVFYPDLGNMGVAGGESFYFDDIKIFIEPPTLPVLPLTFENPNLDYEIASFGGPSFEAIPVEIIPNPDMSGINTSATVLHMNKPEGAQWWAGMVMNLGAPIDFSTETAIEIKVWSPRAGVPISLKIEDQNSPPDGNGDPSVAAEVQAITTVANEWETLVFDLTADGSFSSTIDYNGYRLFADLGTAGVAGGESYYFDDIKTAFIQPSVPSLPMTFEEPNIQYQFTGFGAADFGPIPTEIISNPDMSGINTSATVLHINKPEGAQVWAGANKKLIGNIDLASLGSVYEVKVWSPRAGVPILFKVEDFDSPPDPDGAPTIFAEVLGTTTVANAWEILTFDLSEDIDNYSVDNEYDQVVIFPDNGNMGVAGGESFYFDDIQAVLPPFPTIPISFEDPEINYVIGGFGAADFGPIPTEVTTNPDMSGANTSATVGHINKTEGAQVWAGAFIPLNGDIDLATLGGVYEMKVWSPRVGVPINFKVEDLSSPPDANGAPSIFAETTVMTTTSNEWEVMTFDLTTDVDNYSVDNEYDQVVIFPDFGSEGIGESYFVDDIVSTQAVSIKEVALTEASLKIYPNPAFNELTISFETYISGDTELVIFNSLGQRCLYQDLGRISSGIQNNALNVNKLSNGIYFLNLIVNGELLTARKFIIEK